MTRPEPGHGGTRHACKVASAATPMHESAFVLHCTASGPLIMVTEYY